MATDTPLLTRVRVAAAAVETTTGTAATVGASQGVFNIFDPKMTPAIPATQRQGQGSLTKLNPIPGARSGKMTFKTEIYNAASAPQWLSVLLAGCGFAVNTGVWGPVTGNATTITLGFYQAGRFKSICGAQGNFKITGEYGKPAMIEWEFTGKWVAPSSVAMIAPTFPTVQPPRFAGAVITYATVAYKQSKLEFDMGNVVSPRQDVSDVTGYHSFIITDRNPVFKVDPEALPLGTQDWYAAHLAETGIAFSCQIGTVANNIITIAAAALQLLNPPQDGDRAGILTDELEFQATSPTPDGELTITAS
jgi:hypothetical protein